MHPDVRALEQLTGQYRQMSRSANDRGAIYDHTGDPLGLSVPSYSVFLDPGIEGWDPAKTPALAPFIGKKAAADLSGPLNRRFYWIKRYLSREEAQAIVEAGGKGFFIREERKRTYPKGNIFSHLLGYCDSDGWGLAGVELKWNNVLYIPERMKTRYRGAAHFAMQQEREEMLSSGQGLYLTVDSMVQYAVERFLAEGAVEHKAKWAAAVVLDSRSGAVRALASWPAFDSNDRSTFGNVEALRNNAINRVYEPGSTFKPIMVAMSLDRGVINTKRSFRCPARIKIADAVMSDAVARDNGTLTIAQILEKSSNVGMAQLGMLNSAYDTHADMKNWGIGHKTGIMLNGEEEGLLLPPEQWYGIIPTNVAIGQGFAVSPLQLTAAFNAIVNEGVLLRPYIVERAVDPEGNEIFHSVPQEVTRVISSQTADWLRQTLRGVVVNGTGKGANSPEVAIAAKTGTSQIAQKGQYIKGRYHASIIGFWPVEKPEYTMLVVFGDVSGQRYYGGQVAAPVFRKIVEEIQRLRGLSSLR